MAARGTAWRALLDRHRSFATRTGFSLLPVAVLRLFANPLQATAAPPGLDAERDYDLTAALVGRYAVTLGSVAMYFGKRKR